MLEDATQTVELVGHLFALVERERDVVTGLRPVGVQRLGQREQHRQAALHVGRAEPVQHVAIDPRRRVAVRRHGVEMSTQDDAPIATELGARDHVVADHIDRE